MQDIAAPWSTIAAVLAIFPFFILYNAIGILIAWDEVVTSMERMSLGSDDTMASFSSKNPG